MGSCQSSPAAAVATSPPQSSKAGASKKEHIAEKKQNGVGNGVVISPVGTESTAASADSPTIHKQKIKETATSETTDQQQQLRDSQHNRIPSQDVSIGSSFNSSNSDDGGSSQSSSNNNNNNKATNGNHHHHQLHCMKSPAASNTKSLNNGDLSTSHRRRKSRQLDHSDSRVGLHEIISGDLKNPNLVRIEVPLGKPIEEVYEGVHDGPVLGSGISGIVRLVKHKKTGVQYAVKCLDLALIDSEEGLKQLKEEIYIMCQLDHPNIVRLEEVYESHSEIYLVQEICKGGELFDRLDEQPDYHYTEAQCAKLVKQMLSSVRYIHNKGIIHRDLKLENFLFSDLDAKSELKMIDFGLSKHFQFGEVHHEAVGTPYTVAPEVIRGSYDERCDVWAVGVITYLLLSGEPPFGGCGGPETLMEVRDNILTGEFAFEPEDIWETVSGEAKEFIKSLLVLDPMDRPTAQQCSNLKWLKMWKNRENNGTELRLNPAVVKALVGFKEYSDMRKLLCEVLSFTLLPEQIEGLRKEFELYDVEGTGEISLNTMKKVLIGNASTGSLGGLSEEEVEDIFNALRVRKGEATIHWHDFIAAGLSQCQVDERNLRLAFDRLDQEHKGYITFDNVMDLLGDEAFDTEDDMLNCWAESMKDVDCKTALITYEDFVLLMKGQNRDKSSLRKSLTVEPLDMQAMQDLLSPVPEIEFEMEEEANEFAYVNPHWVKAIHSTETASNAHRPLN
ncbi:calcium-dependent protein kinase [Skeletonema marinoi]|uniref:Calcium-dependent protein kinase n=1 Tax=Skeletonema marinoi TaxID=267567 RepID=A0AAD8YEI6_9STRA|nr:calcium-dependent protein kinase [Skeletonema marinoi]